MKRHEQTCFVYIMAAAIDGKLCGPVKVGMADDPHKRRSGIQTGNPNEIQVAIAFELPNKEIARLLERAFHDVLSDKRLRGEWFDMDVPTAIMSMCANIRAALMHHTNFEGAVMDEMLRMSGVLAAEENLRRYGHLPGAEESIH